MGTLEFCLGLAELVENGEIDKNVACEIVTGKSDSELVDQVGAKIKAYHEITMDDSIQPGNSQAEDIFYPQGLDYEKVTDALVKAAFTNPQDLKGCLMEAIQEEKDISSGLIVK